MQISSSSFNKTHNGKIIIKAQRIIKELKLSWIFELTLHWSYEITLNWSYELTVNWSFE